MWPSEASSGVFTIPQLHSYKPSGTELPTEQLIRDDIWRAATDTRSTALYTDTTNHTRQSNKTDAFISAYAENPREKHSCASNSRTLATPRSWLWFPRNYELIKRTPLMQYKPLGIKAHVYEQILTKTQLSTFTEITVLTGIHVSGHLLNSLHTKKWKIKQTIILNIMCQHQKNTFQENMSNASLLLFLKRLFSSPRLHFYDKKYRKLSNIGKYYYYLKQLFSIWIYF